VKRNSKIRITPSGYFLDPACCDVELRRHEPKVGGLAPLGGAIDDPAAFSYRRSA
jgi:hypothetical protein